MSVNNTLINITPLETIRMIDQNTIRCIQGQYDNDCRELDIYDVTYDLSDYDDELATRLAVQFYVKDIDVDRLRNIINEIHMVYDSIDTNPITTIKLSEPISDLDVQHRFNIEANKLLANTRD